MEILLKLFKPWTLCFVLLLGSVGLGKLYFDMRDSYAQLELKSNLKSVSYVKEIEKFKTQIMACMFGRTNRDALVDCLRNKNCEG